MRHINIVTAVALIFSLMILSYSQSPQPQSRTGETSSQAANAKGKALVKRLPADLEGVELKDGGLRVKPGYKFMTAHDGIVLVARLKDAVGDSTRAGTPPKTSHKNDPGDDDDKMSSGELAALLLLGAGAVAGILYASRTQYSCSCPTGGCKAVNSGEFLYCDKSDQNPCKDHCTLETTTKAGKKTTILSY